MDRIGGSFSSPGFLGRSLRRAGRWKPLLANGPEGRTARHFIVVIARENPSFDYYLRPRLEAAAPHVSFETAELASDPALVLGRSAAQGSYVVLCRYASRAWIRELALRRGALAGVALFLDDDVEAVIDDPSAPISYRLDLFRRHMAHRAGLAAVLDRVYVSTQHLARRYDLAHPVVMGPTPSAADQPTEAHEGARRVCFHVTGAHRAEVDWILPVLSAVARRRPDLQVEAIADASGCAWRTPAGVVLRPLVAWPQYRRETRSLGASVLLVPLLDNAANRARSPTKRIDAHRMGAVMLTNADAVYAPTVEEQADGMIVPLAHDAWVERILELVDTPDRLVRLRAFNARLLDAWRVAASLDPLPGAHGPK
jgi:hypothetical protein